MNVKAQTRSKKPVSWEKELNQEGNFVSEKADHSSVSSAGSGVNGYNSSLHA